MAGEADRRESSQTGSFLTFLRSRYELLSAQLVLGLALQPEEPPS